MPDSGLPAGPDQTKMIISQIRSDQDVSYIKTKMAMAFRGLLNKSSIHYESIEAMFEQVTFKNISNFNK